MEKLLSTTEFAEAVGISESTARRLADGGELQIQKTKGGHRKIPVTEAVRYVQDAGITIAKPELLDFPQNATGQAESYPNQLLAALRDGNEGAVLSILQTMRDNQMPLAEICDGPIRYAMNTIGSTWPQDKRSIFLEHRATMVCVRALCHLRSTLPGIARGAPTALGAAPQDDPYLLPSLMVSLILHGVGYQETNLGPNTPVDVLTDSVEETQPSLVWLALTNPVRSHRHQQEIDYLAKTVQSYGGAFLVGGQSASTCTSRNADVCVSVSELRSKASHFSRK